MLLQGGCAFRNQFREVPEGQPRASLSRWSRSDITIFSINSQPTSFWNTSGKFDIPPGRATVEVVAQQEPYGYESIVFNAQRGKRYALKVSDDQSTVSLFNVTSESVPQFITRAQRTLE